MFDPGLRIGVVGATGAVGRVTLDYLSARGHTNVRAFASRRSAGRTVAGVEVEEATAETLGAGDLDVCFFSVGTRLSRELVPAAAGGGAICVDKSAAFRLTPGIPLVVPEVNGARALEHDGIVANPNCCAIPLTMTLAPLRQAVGLRSVRVATYQSVSGAGAGAVDDLRREASDDHRLRMDWDFDGVEYDEEVKLREETRKILELPDLPVSATCVRVPVVVGTCGSGLDRDRVAPLACGRRGDPRAGAGPPDPGRARPRRGDRNGRRAGRAHSARRVDRERPRPLRRLRQPP